MSEYLSDGDDGVEYTFPYTEVGLRCRPLAEDESERKVRDEAEVTEDDDVASDAVDEPVELGSSVSIVRDR